MGTADFHFGGAIHFRAGWETVCGGGRSFAGRQLTIAHHRDGKILRINADGSIPTDNPFYNTPGADQAIWALGLRNPFTTAFQPGTGRFFINDVGKDSWEEIDNGIAGANYGWPTTEGTFDQSAFPNLTEPIYAYSHVEAARLRAARFTIRPCSSSRHSTPASTSSRTFATPGFASSIPPIIPSLLSRPFLRASFRQI